MSPDEIKTLRKQLGLTTRDLAAELALDAKTIQAWEAGDRFPTKRHVQKLQQLGREPPRARAETPADPAKLGRVVARLAADPDLLDEVAALVGQRSQD